MTKRPPFGIPTPDNITHTWDCPRHASTLQSLRTTPDGRHLEVAICSHCQGTDMTARLHDERHGDDAA
jgi:hypothetical protein